MIKVTYNSPAMPQYPYDVQLGVVYECVKVKGKYIIKGANFNRAFDLKFLKCIFKPCDNYSWDMLEEKNEVVATTTKKVAKSTKK